jgi:hypothetical protein
LKKNTQKHPQLLPVSYQRDIDDIACSSSSSILFRNSNWKLILKCRPRNETSTSRRGDVPTSQMLRKQ